MKWVFYVVAATLIAIIVNVIITINNIININIIIAIIIILLLWSRIKRKSAMEWLSQNSVDTT